MCVYKRLMKRKIVVVSLLSLLGIASGSVLANELSGDRVGARRIDSKGIVRIKSSISFAETVEKLEAAIEANSALKIVAKIDHAANAKAAGQALRPTVLFIFGNPLMGTPLMAASQTAALDLPQKIIVFEDEKGGVFVVYNDPAFVARRHGIALDHPAVTAAETGLGNLAKAATTK